MQPSAPRNPVRRRPRRVGDTQRVRRDVLTRRRDRALSRDRVPTAPTRGRKRSALLFAELVGPLVRRQLDHQRFEIVAITGVRTRDLFALLNFLTF